MIRRAHQIAVSLFLEETGALGITNRQYGILLVLKHRPGIDQITVAKHLGLDRSTTGMVLNKLERDGLVGRVIGANDRRKRSLKLTPAGERMLRRLAAPGRRSACFQRSRRRNARPSSTCSTSSRASSTIRRACRRWRNKYSRGGRRNPRAANPPHPEETAKRSSRRMGRPGRVHILRDAGLRPAPQDEDGRGRTMTWRAITRYGSCGSASTTPRSPRGSPTTRRRTSWRSRGTRGSRGRETPGR